VGKAKSYKLDLVGVLGHPVAENPTVVMMEAAFRELRLPFSYLAIEVLPEGLGDAIRGVRAMGFKGVNLTIPHKVEVMRHLDEVTEKASLIGAVNTVYRVGDRLVGENTDGAGFLKSLQDDGGVDPRGGSFIVLGAGGASRAICVELSLAGAARIAIVNRDEGRGRAEYIAWEPGLRLPEGFGVLVNATSVGLYPDPGKPDIDYGSVRSGMTVCDVIPNPPRSAFLREAESRGASCLDGLGMLVNQGTIGFELWTGEKAPSAAMRAALEREFRAE
jgi:shikimate dehydrogenase